MGPNVGFETLVVTVVEKKSGQYGGPEGARGLLYWCSVVWYCVAGGGWPIRLDKSYCQSAPAAFHPDLPSKYLCH